jgi:hypothetical protein
MKNQDLMGVARSPRIPGAGGLRNKTGGLTMTSKEVSGSFHLNSNKQITSIKGAKMKQITFSPTE